MLREKSDELLSVFPGLLENEKGKTIDELWTEAVTPVVDLFHKTFKATQQAGGTHEQAIEAAYSKVTEKYDQYTLRSYFTEVAGWSDDCVRLYDWGEPHVV